MRTTIHALPERVYRPDPAMFRFIDETGGDPGQLFALAQMALNGVAAHKRRGDDSPKACQGIANGLGLACFALATMLGIPRSQIEGALLDDDGGAA